MSDKPNASPEEITLVAIGIILGVLGQASPSGIPDTAKLIADELSRNGIRFTLR